MTVSPGTGSDNGTEVREVDAAEFGEAAALIARAMAENPIHLAVWPDPAARSEGLQASVGANLSAGRRFAWGAWSDGRLAGVAVVARPGTCRPSPEAFERSRERMEQIDRDSAERWSAWRQGWGRHDPARAHAHFGPFAVEADLRRQGFGALLMRRFCAYLDEIGSLGHLEADKEENVPFSEGFGFRAIAEESVVGVPTWFMSREPQTPPTQEG
jgi:GNAT superfamily N-acetyltransferase